MLRFAPTTVNVLTGDGSITKILCTDLVSHEKAVINQEFATARDNGVSMTDALAMEDLAYRQLDALKATVKQSPNVVLGKDYKTGHFVVAEGVCF